MILVSSSSTGRSPPGGSCEHQCSAVERLDRNLEFLEPAPLHRQLGDRLRGDRAGWHPDPGIQDPPGTAGVRRMGSPPGSGSGGPAAPFSCSGFRAFGPLRPRGARSGVDRDPLPPWWGPSTVPRLRTPRRYAEVGTRVGVGDTLCIIEAMKLDERAGGRGVRHRGAGLRRRTGSRWSTARSSSASSRAEPTKGSPVITGDPNDPVDHAGGPWINPGDGRVIGPLHLFGTTGVQEGSHREPGGDRPPDHPGLPRAGHQDGGRVLGGRPGIAPRAVRRRGGVHRAGTRPRQLSQHAPNPGRRRDHRCRGHPSRIRLHGGERGVLRDLPPVGAGLHWTHPGPDPVHGRQGHRPAYHDRAGGPHRSWLHRDRTGPGRGAPGGP